MAAESGGARTLFEHRAARRQTSASFDPMEDYGAEVSARVVDQGPPREWPACTCGAEVCPDGEAA